MSEYYSDIFNLQQKCHNPIMASLIPQNNKNQVLFFVRYIE